ncbi:Uncharacterized protein APZ42_034205 [Daphnia magna]|uniref:Uncharacterized protein n=1 Tax=Daphnia magna TaxID=35525 RepID=A0A164KCK1_9CRUS|nr:Uncharacterized protein APZ42_034205 [Daphnia magna]
MKEIEEFVGKVLGSDKMTKNMSLTERQEQFGKTFASNPKSFMFLPGDKVVLRVISEVCKQVLESYQSVLSPHEKKNKSKSTTFSSGKQFTAMTGKSGSDQLTSKVDSDILVDEEATTTVNKLTLEEYLLRWENRLKLQNMSSLFSIKENIITCLMKQWNSAIYYKKAGPLNYLCHGCFQASLVNPISKQHDRSLLLAMELDCPELKKTLERFGGSGENYFCKSRPSIEEIEATILRAKEDSKSTMVSMGVIVSDAECFNFDNRLAWKRNQAVRQNELSNELDVDEECESIENQGNDFLDEVDSFDASNLTFISNADFKDYREILERHIVSNCNELGNKNFGRPRFGPLCNPTHLIESSAFVVLTSDDGSQKVIKKSSVV